MRQTLTCGDYCEIITWSYGQQMELVWIECRRSSDARVLFEIAQLMQPQVLGLISHGFKSSKALGIPVMVAFYPLTLDIAMVTGCAGGVEYF